MGHTPFGYRIVNGSPVIVESEAECIRMIYRNYLDGMGLADAGKYAGYPAVPSTIKRILTRECYCDDAFYPPIIEKEMLQRAKEEIKRRAAALNRNGKTRRVKPVPQSDFVMGKPLEDYDDPYQKAEYLYSLIESKVVKWQK